VTDDGTLGGYLSRHQRPPAFGGPDGRAYSVAIVVDDHPDAAGRYGASLLFVRWTEAGDTPDGHVETDYLVWADTRPDARGQLQALYLHDVKRYLDEAVALRQAEPGW
jgi:hypothetical protein